MKTLTLQRLKQVLTYCWTTGQFHWLIDTKNTNQGDVAGAISEDGYRVIGIDGEVFQAHRLVYWYVSEIDPTEYDIDHEDHDRTNNRYHNLRLVTRKENGKNKSLNKRNKSGHTAIYPTASGKWLVRPMINGEHKSLGVFTSLGQALLVRDKAYKDANFHQNHGS